MSYFTPKRIALALAAAAIGMMSMSVAAPVPKSTTDPREASSAGEPVEPSIDLDKVAKDPVLRAQVARNRALSSNNLKQIALAVHNYQSANNRMPGNITDKDGKPLLSWRVLLLPYLEQDPLYKQFKLDEAWNSENNIKLLETMPKVYQSPRAVVKKKGYTAYLGFSGPNGLFNKSAKDMPSIVAIADGTSNTILAMEVSTAQPWSKPVDVEFDRKKELPDLGKAYGASPLASMCDGSVRSLDLKKIKPETLKNAIDPNDGNPLGKDW